MIKKRSQVYKKTNYYCCPDNGLIINPDLYTFSYYPSRTTGAESETVFCARNPGALHRNIAAWYRHHTTESIWITQEKMLRLLDEYKRT